MTPTVYIVASGRNGTIYTGVTSDLARRAHEHRHGLIDGFSTRYGCKLLVWYEAFVDMPTAIACEKRIKEWRRAWKLELIEKDNPTWRDLSINFLGPA